MAIKIDTSTRLSWTDVIHLVLLLVTIIGLTISINNNRQQMKVFHTQQKIAFFADYTKRFQDIMLNFPEDVFNDNFDFKSDTRSEQVIKYMRAYFNLCGEEYDLWKSGYVEDRIWDKWQQGIEFFLSKKVFKDAWYEIHKNAVYFQDFEKWIDDTIQKYHGKRK